MLIQPLSNAQVKHVNSLKIKKYRDQSGCFVAEGIKCISELLERFQPQLLVLRPDSDMFHNNPFLSSFPVVVQASDKQFKQLSSLVTPTDCIAVFTQAAQSQEESQWQDRIVALDGIQDPGNLGTILRTCDWMGFHTVLCSRQTADCYAPKVVQATMGALARVQVVYNDLPDTLQVLRQQDFQILGTTLDGENIYSSAALQNIDKAVIVMGNEGNGITPSVARLLTCRLTIPAFAEQHVESLNVSIATAIILSEIQRNR